jgi:periplasmic divalent cation tolerance protein
MSLTAAKGMVNELMTAVVQVQVVHDDRAALNEIIETLIAEQLIACGQLLGPLESVFFWDGAVRREQEWLALLKTSGERVRELLARVAELHSYEVPELLVLDVQDGHEPYLRWVRERTAEV